MTVVTTTKEDIDQNTLNNSSVYTEYSVCVCFYKGTGVLMVDPTRTPEPGGSV